jgi:formylglycine-generating enzyme required for sulfatase activity
MILGGLATAWLGVAMWGAAKSGNQGNKSKIAQLLPLAPFTSPSTFRFETVTVNQRGQIINREQRQSTYFTEDLGNGVSLEMVKIPGGEFMMGSPVSEAERLDDEGPQHRVTIPPFYMGRFAVTQPQWRQVMGNNPQSFKANDRPVQAISWNDAQGFCKKLS